jgi:hypothetical protein
MEELVFPHHPEECRLFIDVTNLRSRAVFLQNGNLKPSTLVAFSLATKGSLGSMTLSLNLIRFKNAFGRYVRSYGYGIFNLAADWIYEVLLFYMLVGKSSNRKILQRYGLANLRKLCSRKI